MELIAAHVRQMHVRFCDANTASWTFDERYRASRTCFSVSFTPPLFEPHLVFATPPALWAESTCIINVRVLE
jgi:hypothetical protein